MTPIRRRTALRRGTALLGTALLLTALTTAATVGPASALPGDTAAAGAAAPADDSGTGLAVGEQASSGNMKLLANLPKSGAFASEGAFNSDLAFQGDYAFQGNYEGFNIFDISKRSNPVQVAQVVCPGAQNDVAVFGKILVLSTDSSRDNATCVNAPKAATFPSEQTWEGIKVFDISDVRNPRYVAAVETDCGSHTHTLAPKGSDLFVYVSSYRPAANTPDCLPPHDKVSVVKIPMGAPQNATLAAEPVLFPDGGFPGSATTSATSGCHDLTAYIAKNLMAGACMGEGALFDITDRLAPRLISRVTDPNFAFWHSATFNNDATTVLFTDELGGGGAATCNPTIGPKRGANAIYDITNLTAPVFGSYYKITRAQESTENCVAHNGSLIPVKGRDIMVQSWYQGGISVFDFTNPAKPTELGWFDRGPLSKERLILGGSWSAYYYDGYIYSSDIQKGFDVLRITDPATNQGKSEQMRGTFNPQTQTAYKG